MKLADAVVMPSPSQSPELVTLRLIKTESTLLPINAAGDVPPNGPETGRIVGESLPSAPRVVKETKLAVKAPSSILKN